MRNRYRRVRALSLVPAIAVVASCMGAPVQTGAPAAVPEAVGNYFVGREPVYAHLKRGSGGSWVFAMITDTDSAADSDYLVRLNDLTPAFDTRVAECMTQNYPESHRCSITNPFREKVSGMIDKIISGSIAVGTAGKMTDISATYETSFNETAYNQAVDEALVNTGLDATRRQLIDNIEQYHELLDRGRAEIADLERQAEEARQSMGSAYPYEVEPRITGLTDFYDGDVDFDRIVTLTAMSADHAVVTAVDRRSILPCDVRTCLADSASAIASLQQDLARHRSGLATQISPDTVAFAVSCDGGSVETYLVRIECPDEIVLQRNTVTLLPVTVTILSRDFVGLYPDFEVEDDRLRIKIDGSGVTFANPTSGYLTVAAQTLYYNSLVQTTSLPIELAPGVSVTHPIDRFVSPAIKVESTYRQMTPGKAENTSFHFGFAARYRVAGNAEEQTVFARRTFNIGCTINNRLSGGTCDDQ